MVNDVFEQQHMLSGKLPAGIRMLYLVLLFTTVLLCSASWFLKMDVVVQAPGQLRPATERTLIRPTVSGQLDSIFVREGELVQKGALIASLVDTEWETAATSLHQEHKEKSALQADLDRLTKAASPAMARKLVLQTAIYQQQLETFLEFCKEKELLLHHALQEKRVAESLFQDKVIARVEYEQKLNDVRMSEIVVRRLWLEQVARWNREKQLLNGELLTIESKSKTAGSQKRNLELRSPVSGVVMGINDRYRGNTLQAGELFCSISPEDTLIVECYINPSDIGFIYEQQKVLFRLDAFDHKLFGSAPGEILHIDPDFSLLGEQPIFKIRCSIDPRALRLSSGYKAVLKKGIGVEARFLIARRSVWQLLFEKLDSWLDPVTVV